MNFLLVLVPVSLVLAYVVHAPHLWVFFTAAAAIVPLAEWIRKATDELAKRSGPALGGLIGVSLGNLAELVLALFVLRTGATDVVKGQITGAIIGNGLLGLGLSILIGTWKRGKLTFQRERAGVLSSTLILVTIALLVPALFDHTERSLFHAANPEAVALRLSLGVSVVLIVVYVANLVYTLVTLRSAFATEEHAQPAQWSLARGVLVLAFATAFTAWEAELVADALDYAAERLGVTGFFLGIIVLALVGNFAEYLSAISFAWQGRMDLSLSITLGSTIQIALLLAPLLVLISYLLGYHMDLVFANPLELIAIASVAFTFNAIAHDGEATWFEGLLLFAVYAILGLAFFFVTE